MLPERFSPDDPREWLQRAHSNLIQAGVEREGIYAVLISLLEQAGEQVPEYIRDATRLTDYAVEARYPGLDEAVDREEYQEALALAEAVVRWVEESIA